MVGTGVVRKMLTSLLMRMRRKTMVATKPTINLLVRMVQSMLSLLFNVQTVSS